MLLPRTFADEPSDAGTAPHAVRSASTIQRRRIDSMRLLEGAREVVIDHHGSEYHLRLTRNDKLILTK